VRQGGSGRCLFADGACKRYTPTPRAHRLKRHARARRRLCEDHRHRPACKGLEALIARVELLLGVLPALQHVQQLVLGEVVQVEEVLAWGGDEMVGVWRVGVEGCEGLVAWGAAVVGRRATAVARLSAVCLAHTMPSNRTTYTQHAETGGARAARCVVGTPAPWLRCCRPPDALLSAKKLRQQECRLATDKSSPSAGGDTVFPVYICLPIALEITAARGREPGACWPRRVVRILS